MLTAVVLTFIIGYAAIVFEHPLKIDKTVPALIMAAFAWAFISLGHLEVLNEQHFVAPLEGVLVHHVGKIAEILIFLIGAMTIVELVDLHKGFNVITNRIRTTNKVQMLWLTAIMAFFLSSVLDNLTTTIVFISLLRRLVPLREERLMYVCMIIIAANAGGAWSPIGDVTTTMLWIDEKVSTLHLMINLFLPSIICLVVPVLLASRMNVFKGNITPSERDFDAKIKEESVMGSKMMLIAGLGGLIFVPIFKTITHLPPYMGMMLSLSVVWLLSEVIHRNEDFDRKHLYTARYALSRIEMSSILFFLGILLTISAMEAVVAHTIDGKPEGLLMYMADGLRHAIPNEDIVVIIIGVLSAIIDNVPLVAATMGMYPMDMYPMDHRLWHFIAYSAGTGGSMLVIGSAAGVAAMGMEKIDFIWYVKNVTWLAALGFLAGCFVYMFFTHGL